MKKAEAVFKRSFLSTPSARRATAYTVAAFPAIFISIHALREEGDGLRGCRSAGLRNFYPRPPRGGRHRPSGGCIHRDTYFYPRPPRGGRHDDSHVENLLQEFLSTPSARRATSPVQPRRMVGKISIHALREEGDPRSIMRLQVRYNFYPRPPRGGRRAAPKPSRHRSNFYPRPPRGGRRESPCCGTWAWKFLSTPSARRATPLRSPPCALLSNFYPRPPRGGRLFMEDFTMATEKFLSTPSARRATANLGEQAILKKISIHALREEGDPSIS